MSDAPACALCGGDLVEFTRSRYHHPPDGGSCEWCGQPHRLIDGVWVAVDRFTGEPL